VVGTRAHIYVRLNNISYLAMSVETENDDKDIGWFSSFVWAQPVFKKGAHILLKLHEMSSDWVFSSHT
jgi:hypothetical protein